MNEKTDTGIVVVIPARYASTRFPGKPLAIVQGKTMIQRVYEQACKASLPDKVAIATDDERIFEHALSFGATVFMTDPELPSGTDRCAAVAGLFPGASFIINVQGDEPFVQPEQIDLLASVLINHPEREIATLAKRIEDPELLFNPNVVKVVFSLKNKALYFSRHPVPFVRGAEPGKWLENQAFFKHIGLYAFKRAVLLELSRLAPASLEMAESLEQLRWLENGYDIAVGITDTETAGIDTPEDLERVNGEQSGTK
ncbi:MAG: 3-deoxy-manno-octulosonate cytidylyltransferase [Bacteroidota bacterium]